VFAVSSEKHCALVGLANGPHQLDYMKREFSLPKRHRNPSDSGSTGPGKIK
jgi:hypothetical protein